LAFANQHRALHKTAKPSYVRIDNRLGIDPRRRSNVVIYSEAGENGIDSEVESDSKVGSDVQEVLDAARMRVDQMATKDFSDNMDLADKPFLTLGIFVGALALLIGLGRLPSLFWLIGTASLSDDEFREELVDVLLLKKPFAEASSELTTQVLLIFALVGAVLLGELSVNFIEPLKVTKV